jgi:hypothetical protein
MPSREPDAAEELAAHRATVDAAAMPWNWPAGP